MSLKSTKFQKIRNFITLNIKLIYLFKKLRRFLIFHIRSCQDLTRLAQIIFVTFTIVFLASTS